MDEKVNILRFKNAKATWEPAQIERLNGRMSIRYLNDNKVIDIKNGIQEMNSGLNIVNQICYKNEMIEENAEQKQCPEL